MITFHLFTLMISVALITSIVTGYVIKFLHKKDIYDHPNERSSHNVATPRGGGIAILFAVLPALGLINMLSSAPLPAYIPVLGAACILGAISWLDDLHTLGPSIRFLLQILAVSLVLYNLEPTAHGYLGGFLPLSVEKVILGVLWVWFINLFNFMDGIDGITGIETIAIASGITLIALSFSLSIELAETGVILCGAALGFLRWNWHKAKVFMGDVGSIPLGFILGWLLILLAGEGYLITALLIPLYYLSDATLTLIKRALRKEKIWQAHREHFYQKAVQAGLPHDQTVMRIAFLNIILLVCAYLNAHTSGPLYLVIAGLSVTFLLYHFNSVKPSKHKAEP